MGTESFWSGMSCPQELGEESIALGGLLLSQGLRWWQLTVRTESRTGRVLSSLSLQRWSLEILIPHWAESWFQTPSTSRGSCCVGRSLPIAYSRDRMFFGAESLCFRGCSDAWRSVRALGTDEAPEALEQRWMPQTEPCSPSLCNDN